MRPRTVALHALKATSVAVDVVRRPPPGLVVLLYHRVGTSGGTEGEVTRATFAEQMSELAARSAVCTLDDALVELESHHAAATAVTVTFDDGTADFVDAALPALVQHRVPATLYVATDFIESGRSFPGSTAPLSWTALTEALSTGLVTVGSHTHSHRVLDKVDASTAASELDRSCGLIEDRLGVRADHFAYPKGVLGTPASEAAVRKRFRSAALARIGVNRPGRTDPFRLLRTPIQASDIGPWFRRKAAGGLAFEGTVREILNQKRYEDVTT